MPVSTTGRVTDVKHSCVSFLGDASSADQLLLLYQFVRSAFLDKQRWLFPPVHNAEISEQDFPSGSPSRLFYFYYDCISQRMRREAWPPERQFT